MSDGAGIFLLFVFLLAAGTYFLPVIVAFYRNHPDTLAIFLLNFFLGWTLLFWVISLVWAAKSFTPQAPPPGR